jgi:uncharacterized membrane protein YfcA
LDFIHIIILLAAGIVAGFAGGMLGLGGAFIMTPVQFIMYTDMGLTVDLAIKTAFATSLMVVLPTAVSGAWQHSRHKAVWWRAAIIIGVISLIFAFGGAWLATRLSGTVLRTAFGILIILIGIRMVTAREPKYKIEAESRVWLWGLWAIPIGLAAGIFGIGGGVLMIPILVLALRFEMHYAIGTSMAVMILSSVGGTIGYIISGIGVADRLPYSIGYVNLSSWVLLALPSVFMAQIGAMTAHKLPRKPLIYIFTIILLYMGLRLIGVFDWLGWPL